MLNDFANKKLRIMATGAVLGIIVVSSTFFIFTYSLRKYIRQWDTKIYTGVKIQGQDLSGKTKDEAISILNDYIEKKMEDKNITVVVENRKFQLSYKRIGARYDVEGAVDQAIKYGKEKNIIDKNKLIKSGQATDIQIKFNYDDEQINKFEKSIGKELDKKPSDAGVEVENGKVHIIPEQKGVILNVDDLDKKIKAELNGQLDKDIIVDGTMQVSEAKITREQLSKIDGKISTFFTSYASSSEGRAGNIAIATKACDGRIVMPGEMFSYNAALGERTYAKGYRDAPIYKNNEVVDDVGGGICQVSTTLYRAVMRADLKSLERHNHSFKAIYSPLGLDATVTWGNLDYKFKNTYDFPIYIEGKTENKNIVFNIYGNIAKFHGRTYELVTDDPIVVPAKMTEVEDPNLPQGEVAMDKAPIDGYKVRSYLVTYERGREINREVIADDVYTKVDGVKRIGIRGKE